ncbi:MAG TPA: hypothetical protein VKH41_15165 [Myxococcota bacterium]|nr:hypothetical protein [Myxococcota bacterium]
MTLIAVAIPIAIAVSIARRVERVARRLSDPARLQRAFAESGAAALRRAGADPEAVAKLEVVGMGAVGDHGATDLRAALEEARAAMTAPAVKLRRTALQDPPRPPRTPREPRPVRPRRQAPVQQPIGLDTGDRFRLSEPPDMGEQHGPFNANWLALAVAIGAVAYYLMN